MSSTCPRRVGLLSALVAVLAGAGCREAPSPDASASAVPVVPAAPALPDPVVDEVRANILGQRIDTHSTIADLHLPDAFVRCIADRIIQESYQEHTQRVTGAPFEATSPESPAVRREVHPALRGFRAPILGTGPQPTPVPGLDADAAARLVATRLAPDGLLRTLAGALDALGPEARRRSAGEVVRALDALGFPVDLLNYFDVRPSEPGAAARVVTRVREMLGTVEEPAIWAIPFRFVPTQPGFGVATESGERGPGLLRLQVTRDTYWRGEGAGGSLDVARQLAAALPEVPLLVLAEARLVAGLEPVIAAWAPARVTLVPTAAPVSQWAQDNGKGGAIERPGGPTVLATMVPRYASRRDDGSWYDAGDTRAAEALAATGHPVIHSPLLFQGGNLIPVRDPARGERVLLIGEADIIRNTVLGLTAAQVTEAFRVEFGVDRCVVLPSVSFHLDVDVSVRARGDRLVAFVNDRQAAVRAILREGVAAMRRHDVLTPAAAETARTDLEAGRMAAFLDLVGPAVRPPPGRGGAHDYALARVFAADAPDAPDAPVGNLRLFLTALDITAAATLPAGDRPRGPVDSYLRALERTDSRRQALHARLADLGFDLTPVPSLAEASRSLNYVNAVHTHDAVIVPAVGGLYAALDQAAAAAYRSALGPDVRIVPVRCGETLRRSGAIHCAVSVYPAP